MDAIKTSENVEFDVIYADGTRRRAQEGIFFEVENEEMIFHNGTNRATVLFATAESVLSLIDAIGLTKLFRKYIRSDPSDTDTLKILDRLRDKPEVMSSAENQALFRLGQMDMRESIVAMLRSTGEGTFGVTRAALLEMAEQVSKMEVLHG